MVNSYLEEIRRNLPRLLALFDTDRTSASYGMGDRFHWAWGLIDFGNATFQGAAHGLARLWQAGLWPYPTSLDKFLERIDAMFVGTKRLTRHNGSLEEAFPNEGSYCVTALVAFDLLCALDLLTPAIDAERKQRWQQIVAPMIGYLIKADETHALISNHLATAVAALVRWHRHADDAQAEQKARHLLDRILDNQSKEGWFREYEGADPGYQSLCTYYLADVHQTRPDWCLTETLRRSLAFLWHFAHPDGSFGGLYGSRCTRFYYPAGILALADVIPEAQALAAFMEDAIAEQRVVSLSAIDEPNLVPMFNAYAWAATIRSKRPAEKLLPKTPIPAVCPEPLRQYYTGAGLLIDRGPGHYSIISTHKGGVVYHFQNARPAVIDAGIVVRDPQGHIGSTQGYADGNVVQLGKETLEVSAQVTAMPKQLPTPLQFLVIRVLSLTAFRFDILREWIKRRLVKKLITRRDLWSVRNLRRIQLGPDLEIEDRVEAAVGFVREPNAVAFVPIHMASQGYWQIQDEERI